MSSTHRLMWTSWRQQNLKKLRQFLKYSNSVKTHRSCQRCLSSYSQHDDSKTKNLICNGIIRSPFSDIIPQHVTVDELLWSTLERWPDHIAIECSATGHKYSFTQLRKLSGRFATSLRKQGLNPGDVLSVMLPNLPDYPIIVLGAMEAGIILSPINPVYTPYELSHQLSDNNSKAVLTLPEFASRVGEAKLEIEAKTKKEFPLRMIVMKRSSSESLPSNMINYFDMISDNVQDSVCKPTHKPDDIAVLPYSSGTTGLPKGVELTHRNIVSNILQCNEQQIGLITPTTSTHQEILPTILPFFHIYGLVIILLRALFNGCKMVTLSKFEAAPFLSLLKQYQPTVLYAVPPIITFLGNHPLVGPEHFASLNYICNGAGPIAVGDKDKLFGKAKSNGNFHFVQGYGLTETSPLALVSPEWLKDVSRLVPVKSTLAKIMKEDGTLAKPSELGEICIRGPQVMQGYHKRPTETKETIDENGYLHTGDGGFYNEDGTIQLIERMKELIKVQGFQVAPAELEAILRSHPQVSDTGVIGVPDSRTGEKPLAFVVKQGQVSEEDLKNYIASKVSSYKKLGEVIFVDSIPKSQSGKILRRILKEEYMKKKK